MERVRTYRLQTGATKMLRELDSILDHEYGAPESELGNKEDPLDEVIYIILSFQTDVARLQRVWQDLRRTYATWSDVAETSQDALSATLREGGLHVQKARAIRQLLKEVKRRSGSYSLEDLRQLDDEAAEKYLLSLPGLSWKGARCVLMYSLQRNCFPVDTNTFRIFKRVGVIGPRAVYRRKGLHDSLQRVITPKRRRPFHVNLVVHGQRVCVPGRPRCDTCIASEICNTQGEKNRSDDPGAGLVSYDKAQEVSW